MNCSRTITGSSYVLYEQCCISQHLLLHFINDTHVWSSRDTHIEHEKMRIPFIETADISIVILISLLQPFN